ncbi:MAG: peptide deformylase [Clostridia bacterium]|nr:peptide deformylase [Clostridia bacterium]
MAIRNIVKRGDDTLKKVCRPVEKFDAKLHTLLDDMLDTVVAADGAGLAAPQVGILRRVVLVINGDDGFLELINPEIIETDGEQIEAEGCLSVPGIYGTVSRPAYVKVRAQDRFGEFFEVEGEELAARAFCHEIDHLNGTLFTDKVIEYLEEDR